MDREQEQDEEEDENEEEESVQQAVTAAAAALAAMAVGGTKGQEGEEEEEDECSVCLNAIEDNDTDSPAGPPLPCGHRNHAFWSAFLGGEVFDEMHGAYVPVLPGAVQELARAREGGIVNKCK